MIEAKMIMAQQSPEEMDELQGFDISEIEEFTAFNSHVITFGIHSDAVSHLVLSTDCIIKILEYAKIKGITI